MRREELEPARPRAQPAGLRGIAAGHHTLLLDPDAYFWFTVQYPNSLMRGSLGVLDGFGRARATLHIPRLPSWLIGWRFYHAYIVFRSTIDYASTPVPLTLVP